MPDPFVIMMGTILIRNGRLVDSNSLLASGTAFVATEGVQQSEFANVVHISNDGFQSPNLTNHGIYFGQITQPNSTLSHLQTLCCYRKTITGGLNRAESFHSVMIRSLSKILMVPTLRLIPQQNEMKDYVNRYGYFYVANNQYCCRPSYRTNCTTANMVSVGRIEGITGHKPSIIRIRNVSQWHEGYWNEAGYISSMNIEQATIIQRR